jgi:uncharacterized membrane protein YjdF
MSLSKLNARFLALIITSLTVTLVAVYTSGDEQAVIALLEMFFPILAIAAALLFFTRRYWTDARRVG